MKREKAIEKEAIKQSLIGCKNYIKILELAAADMKKHLTALVLADNAHNLAPGAFKNISIQLSITMSRVVSRILVDANISMFMLSAIDSMSLESLKQSAIEIEKMGRENFNKSGIH